MSAQVEEVTASASALADLAQALQAVVQQFKLTAAAEPAARGGGSQTPAKPALAAVRPNGNGNGHYVSLPRAR